MARYFFHYWDGEAYLTDTEGSELRDANAAYLEAFESAQQLAIELIRDHRGVNGARLDVIDEHGSRLFDLPISEAIGGRPAPHHMLARWQCGRASAEDLNTQINAAREALTSISQLLRRL